LYENVDQYALNGLPLDAQWVDIDYMHNYQDFTVDQNRFKDLPDFVHNISIMGIRFVPAIDVGIAKVSE